MFFSLLSSRSNYLIGQEVCAVCDGIVQRYHATCNCLPKCNQWSDLMCRCNITTSAEAAVILFSYHMALRRTGCMVTLFGLMSELFHAFSYFPITVLLLNFYIIYALYLDCIHIFSNVHKRPSWNVQAWLDGRKWTGETTIPVVQFDHLTKT